MIGHDSGAEPIGPLELYNEGISTLKKNQLPQLHLNAVTTNKTLGGMAKRWLWPLNGV